MFAMSTIRSTSIFVRTTRAPILSKLMPRVSLPELIAIVRYTSFKALGVYSVARRSTLSCRVRSVKDTPAHCSAPSSSLSLSQLMEFALGSFNFSSASIFLFFFLILDAGDLATPSSSSLSFQAAVRIDDVTDLLDDFVERLEVVDVGVDADVRTVCFGDLEADFEGDFAPDVAAGASVLDFGERFSCLALDSGFVVFVLFFGVVLSTCFDGTFFFFEVVVPVSFAMAVMRSRSSPYSEIICATQIGMRDQRMILHSVRKSAMCELYRIVENVWPTWIRKIHQTGMCGWRVSITPSERRITNSRVHVLKIMFNNQKN